MQIETQRLILREFTQEDFSPLFEILSDKATMCHYPQPFDENKVNRWIEANIDRYSTFGFGLWAVILKETGRLIGDCGITMQSINGSIKPEIGYHIHKAFQNKGYGSEAAAVCRDFIFEKTTFNRVYSYMKYTNEASWRTAVKIGMKFAEEYKDPVNTVTKVYSITRTEWEKYCCKL